jgi:hypothetical protein
MTLAAMAASLAACLPGQSTKPGPKPAPEPPQAVPSAEALGPVRVADDACSQPPENGEILEGRVEDEGVNYYQIENQTQASAIVKIRNEASGALVVAVYVAPGKTVSIGPLADGAYRQSQAMGRYLAADCRHLDFPSGYGQYDKADTFVAKEGEEGPEGRTETYVLEENDIDGGDGPQALSADKFNAP